MDDLRTRPVKGDVLLGGSDPEGFPPPPTPAKSWLRGPWRWALLVVAVVLGALVVLGWVAMERSRPGAPEGSTFHQANLAPRETAFLAAMLVDVPGYRYTDASQAEVQRVQDEPTESMVGVSLHSVVDQQGTEVAYLQLREFAPGVIPESRDAEVVSIMWGAEPISQTLVDNRLVFLFENPAQPQSRYTYVWLWRGTVVAADSGDGQRLIRWIRAYLPVLDASIVGEP